MYIKFLAPTFGKRSPDLPEPNNCHAKRARASIVEPEQQFPEQPASKSTDASPEVTVIMA